MKQLIQNLKTGELELKELPIPLCKSKGVLVRTVSSLVSIGTEKSLIDLAQKGLIGKARARPDLVKQVLRASYCLLAPVKSATPFHLRENLTG